MISPSTPSAASWRKKSLQAAVKARPFETFQNWIERNLLQLVCACQLLKPIAWEISEPMLPACALTTFSRRRGWLHFFRDGVMRRPNRIALLQLGGEKYFRRRPQSIDSLQQQARSRCANLISRLVNRRQRRIRELGELQAVKPGDGQVFGTSQAEFTSSLQHTKSHEVVAGKNRSRARQHAKKPESGLVTTLCIEERFLDKLRLNFYAGFL
jgi:hypothetical protein